MEYLFIKYNRIEILDPQVTLTLTLINISLSICQILIGQSVPLKLYNLDFYFTLTLTNICQKILACYSQFVVFDLQLTLPYIIGWYVQFKVFVLEIYLTLTLKHTSHNRGRSGNFAFQVFLLM